MTYKRENDCTFKGRLTKDLELRFTKGGSPVTSGTVAVNRYYTQDGEQQKETTFVDFTVYGKDAENMVRITRKGTYLHIGTHYQKRRVVQEDGTSRTFHDFIIEWWDLLANGRSRDEVPDDDGMDEEDWGGDFGDDDPPF